MSNKEEHNDYNFETMAIHGKKDMAEEHNSSTVPIYQNSAYQFKNSDAAAELFSLNEEGYVYSRISNPTNKEFEDRISSLEGGVGAHSTSSGMSAISLIILSLSEWKVNHETLYQFRGQYT